jgi:hypothetical protein
MNLYPYHYAIVSFIETILNNNPLPSLKRKNIEKILKC